MRGDFKYEINLIENLKILMNRSGKGPEIILINSNKASFLKKSKREQFISKKEL